MKIKTPSLAPRIEDKNMQTFLQFIRDDINTLATSDRFDTRKIKMTSGRGEVISGQANLVGAIPIAMGVTLDANTVVVRPDGSLLVTADFGGPAMEVTWLTIKG